MSPLAAVIFRWLARLAALFFAGVFLLFVAGEFMRPTSGPPSRFVEWGGIILLLIAVAGMILAWKWELTGALISLAALVLHVSLVRYHTYVVIWLAAIPGVLYLADWLLRRFWTATPTDTH
jgi:hypothetical protein